MSVATEGDCCAFSEIDSERFGVRVARAAVTPTNLSGVLDFCATEQIDLLIARSQGHHLTVAQSLEGLGFSLMDSLVYYAFDLSKHNIPDDSPRVHVREFVPSDEPQIARVAAQAFQEYSGHYHADPKLDRSKCDEGYVSWAVRSCALKQVATEVLVAECDNRIVGFATLRLNAPQEGEGVLFAVAPEAQGMGIYRSFMIQGLRWCNEQKTKRMIVSTQITNVAVQKVWCRLGFEPSHSFYTFHKWFTKRNSAESVQTTRTSFSLGEEASLSRVFTQEDVESFSVLSGDNNPVHLDERFAKETRFRGRIIHGMLVASLISSVLGTALPGPGSVYLSQKLSFRAPARVGDRLTAKVRVTEWDAIAGRIVLATEVINQNEVQLITGEAKLVLSSFLR
jgi:acyl dehydratase/ribosomal protein S18 acetylase RimI-like enzyme